MTICDMKKKERRNKERVDFGIQRKSTDSRKANLILINKKLQGPASIDPLVGKFLKEGVSEAVNRGGGHVMGNKLEELH